MYNRTALLGGKGRRPSPSWLIPLLVRAVPQLRRCIAHCIEAIRSDKHGRYVNRWHDEWEPRLTARTAVLRAGTGGILSHPAIISREFGIPAVAATGNATRLLHDGQIVTGDRHARLVNYEG